MSAVSPSALPPSLYSDTAHPAPVTPPIDSDRTVSVAIVGGGIAGLSAALHLAEAGVDTCVLEAHEPAWGASGRNGGQVNPGLKFNPDDLLTRFGDDLGRRMIAMAWGAPDFTFDLIRRLGIDCNARQNGTLRAATNAVTNDALRITAAQCAAHGMPTRLLDADAMQSATGSDRYPAAMLDPRGGDLHPLNYARGLAAAAQTAGAAIHGDSRVLSASRQGGQWKLKTEKATVTADKILVLTNAYSDQLWPHLKKSLVPIYSSIVATEPLPDHVAARILPHRPVLYETGHITIYYRIDGQKRLLMGGRGPQSPITGTTNALAYLQHYATRLWPDLAAVRWTHAWNGQLAITPDHLPHLHAPTGDVLIYLGCNGRGVALATTMGKQLAQRLIGGPSVSIDLPFTDIQPMRFHAFWPIGAHAAMLWGRMKDRLGI
ncbi:MULTISPECIES: NAD(P)/FAD-dependent oxidoreductase [unclassified Rhizobium]|uniref:NAD(P)/FAD-dependent oxidoreductase n=1 Tax=unclassified Rhizobium TaxID=2613769 RepID=UPI000712A439|nr:MULTISPECIES: FAD-binding oxidoreductase [unclassified Rhizobium]KQS98324.1 oxidoreductase [Rhizobium sp. Leaf391]KQT04191.1 oxidoreductase [Rhizobium sp. Leaf386]KQT95373.1 oxidoreductase [Rhizobium sp. Leaf453]